MLIKVVRANLKSALKQNYINGGIKMEKNYQVVFAAQSKVELQEAEIPEPKENEVLIKTLVSQISTGTELTMLEANVEPGSPWAESIKYPTYPGYSNVGEIVAVGANVDPSLVGKRALTLGKHAKYVIGNPTGPNFSLVPDGVDSDDAVFGVIAQITLASIRCAQIRPGETAVVFGAGLIGQLVARLAKIAGALNVIVADVSDYRLGMVPQESVFTTLNTSGLELSQITDFIKANNDGRLADIVFETTGFQGLLDTETRCVANNGKIIVTSSPKGKSVVDFDLCNRRGITIICAHNAAMHTNQATNFDRWTRKADSEYFMQLIKKELTTVRNMITHKESYKNAVEMYNMLMADRTKALAVHLNWED